MKSTAFDQGPEERAFNRDSNDNTQTRRTCKFHELIAEGQRPLDDRIRYGAGACAEGYGKHIAVECNVESDSVLLWLSPRDINFNT